MVEREVMVTTPDGEMLTFTADTIPVITAALDAAGVVNTVDFLTEAEHGFAPAGPRYDRVASELHWERVHSLLRRNL